MLITAYMKVLDMTKAASIVILFVLAARLLLKRAPKVFSYALWAVVLFRLLCPVSIEAPTSILPEISPVSESYTLADVPISPVNAGAAAYRAVGDALNGGLGTQHIRTEIPDGSGGVEHVTSLWWEVWVLFGQYVWMAGMAAMAIYAAVSYLKLRRKLLIASLVGQNIYLADEITSPFVLGLIHPKIYLPSSMEQQEQSYILLHERHHIRRMDHIFKALGFLALCIHWFNPLVWAAFLLAGKDMEMSCDEAVVKQLGEDIRADYTASLLSLATGKHIIAGMPLAFGEGDTKGRIYNLARWKKPAIWLVLAALVLCILLAVGLLTNPVQEEPVNLTDIRYHTYGVVEVTYELPGTSFSMVPQDNTPSYSIDGNWTLSSTGEQGDDGERTSLGILTEVTLDKENFDGLFVKQSGSGWFQRESAAAIREDTAKAWMLVYNQDTLYYLLQTKRGELYLAKGYYDYGEKDDPYSDDTTIRWLFKLAVEECNAISSAQEWFDFYENPDDGYQDYAVTAELPEYPGVTFRYADYNILASKEDGEPEILISGMPVWNAFFCDLTGDGLPEICTTVSIGSGLIDGRVIVYDYANGVSYSLVDRGNYDYLLSLKNSQLMVTKRVYNSQEVAERGYLAFLGNTLTIVNAEKEVTELVPGTVYVPYQCISMNLASSFYPFGGDSGYRYLIQDGYFAEIPRDSSAVLSEDYETYGPTVPVTQWKWQTFPYTDEEWNQLYLLSSSSIPNITQQYEKILYQPLNEEKFLLWVDGDIWLVKLSQDGQGRTYIWSIYSLVPESAMGVAQWEFVPTSSARLPVFSFAFDMPYTEISAVCSNGTLTEFNYGSVSDTSLTIPAGKAMYWAPVRDGMAAAENTIIRFTAYDGEDTPYHGTLYISSNGTGDAGRKLYTASLVGTGLHLSPNPEGEGAVISLVGGTSQASEVMEYDLGTSPLELAPKELGNYVLYTNSTKIAVKITSGMDFSGRVQLQDISQGNSTVGTKDLDTNNKTVTFTNLTAARLYRIVWDGSEDCSITITD